ncbi:MAG TPA: LysR family transcriptional regulator [Streptosporangiaceae bacterium]|jgi:DNA-binding transcriptional LysR family regulator|nr:LysR family transcriptional regulator [Streptosporangiaceae bacterium]
MRLSPHVPDLPALEVLLTVARTGSLNSAAAELGVSQQAVSSRIRAIEAQTGVPLVSRTPRGSSLTSEGVVVAEWAARLLDVAAELDAGISALRQDRRSRLRVSASLTVAEALLPGCLVAFRAAAQRRPGPAAEIVLTAANSDAVLAQVSDGQADLGFVEGPRVPRSLRSKTVGHDRLVVVVPPAHPWARRRTVTPAELAAAPLVSREEGSGTRDVLAAALARSLGPGLVQAPVALSLSTTSAIRAAVLAGAGPAVLSRLSVGDDLAAGRLVEVEVPGLDLRRPLRVVWRGAASPPAGAARDLIAHIAARRAGASWEAS